MQSDETSSKEQLSALVDGHLHGEDLTSTMARLLNDPQGCQAWHSYHVIGDVLRSSQMAPQRDDFAFLAKLEQRLAQVAVRPAFDQRPDHQPQPLPLPAKRVAADSANAPVWRWKMIAGLACTALLTVLGVGQWNVPGPQVAAQLAVATPAPLATLPRDSDASSAPVMLRDPALDRLLAEHRQLGGHSALQQPSGFLRNATFEGQQR